MRIGDIETFSGCVADKDQVLKIVEECLEVHSAWEDWRKVELSKGYFTSRSYGKCPEYKHLLDECADVMQATANLLSALGVEDFTHQIRECKARNHARGRI